MNARDKKIIEEMLSAQVEIELNASRLYLIAYQFCSSRNVSLKNIAYFFYDQCIDEIDHARGIIDFMNISGYELRLGRSNEEKKFVSVIEVFERLYDLEVMSYEHMLKVRGEAERVGDFSTAQFMDSYISKQLRDIDKMNSDLVNIRRCGSDTGLFIFDNQFKQ